MKTREALTVSCLPSLEAEVLLSALLGKERSWLFAHSDTVLSSDEELKWNKWIARRRGGEPVAYIIGEREFYGRLFQVTPAVLIPRPATEEVVQRALEFLDHPGNKIVEADAGIVVLSKILRPEKTSLHDVSRARTVVDAGTGSGCIAITLALERPDISVIATDISEDALVIAGKNAERYGVADRIRFLKGSDLEPVHDLQEPFLMVSNPPYIPQSRILAGEVMDFEPQGALFAGDDGMTVLRRLLVQARDHPLCVGVILECEQLQADVLLRGLKS